jgi:hypothetical protein
VGPVDGAIAGLMHALPQAGVFAPGEATKVADWLMARKADGAEAPRAVDPKMHRETALAAWKSLFGGLA